MANSNGKKARKTGGNRASIKRATRHSRIEKVFSDNKMSSDEYRAMKLNHRKALAAKRRKA